MVRRRERAGRRRGRPRPGLRPGSARRAAEPGLSGPGIQPRWAIHLTDTFRRWSARRARVWTLAAERASRPWRQSERPGPGAWAVDAGGLDGLGLVDLRQVVVGDRRCAGRVLQQSVEPKGADSGDCLRQGDDLGAGGCRGDETGDRAATVVAVAVGHGCGQRQEGAGEGVPAAGGVGHVVGTGGQGVREERPRTTRILSRIASSRVSWGSRSQNRSGLRSCNRIERNGVPLCADQLRPGSGGDETGGEAVHGWGVEARDPARAGP